MRQAALNKRTYQAQDRILAGARTLLESAELPDEEKQALLKAVTVTYHHDQSVQRMRQIEALADLVEAVAAHPPATGNTSIDYEKLREVPGVGAKTLEAIRQALEGERPGQDD